MAKKKKRKIITGTLQKHQRGFGFVTVEGMDSDIFIAASSMHGAMNGDTVEVDLIPEYLWKQSPEGIITGIADRAFTEVAGTFQKNRKFGFVVPEGKKASEDIFIRKKDFSGAKTGDKVVAQIVKYPEDGTSAEGRITEILGRRGQAGGDIKSVARTYGLRETFPSRANAEAKAVSRRGITKKDLEGRRDMRGDSIFTIDGADSKDFDDAVSIRRNPSGTYTLGVHIADVTHYVAEGGPLDREALKRGMSAYLLDQVVPMLPKALSNGICSLNPGEDRLALSVDMEIDEAGDVLSHDIYESVIRSCERLVYDDVSDLLEDDDEEMNERYADIRDQLFMMKHLAGILRKKRMHRGSLDFEVDEAYIELDRKGIPVNIDVRERRTSNRMIEEFMLIANETVAEHFFWLEVPFIYRVHEKPEMEKIEKLKVFLRNFGLILRGNPENIHPRAISFILDRVKGLPRESVVNSVTLRSMQKAFYDISCDGHFGLAAKYYCHFTSPIRRYPDLMIHRIIKESLAGKIDRNRARELKALAGEAAEKSSASERVIIEAEREVEKMKKTEYMADHIGEVFDGVISGTTDFGIYVQLPNTVEGLVKVENLKDDYYSFDSENYALIGQHTGRTYRLGDTIRIEVDNVNVERREIDFITAE